MEENTVKTAEKQLPGVPFTKDDPRINRNGRPKGSEDFKTKFYKVIDKLAKQNNITAEEVEEQILLVGYKKAKDGDYSFYRDLMDRLHGRPIQKQEITGADGKDLIPESISQEDKEKLLGLLK